MLYDKDRLDAAYAKIGLLADSAWQTNDDDYIRANQELWMRECALKDHSEENGIPRSVLDTIPNSHLAEYGTYLYNEVRECSYEPPSSIYLAKSDLGSTYVNQEFRNDELFESQEVEKLFNMLSDANSKLDDIEGHCRNFIKNFEMKEISPEIYTLLQTSDTKIKSSVSSNSLDSEPEVAYEKIQVQKNNIRPRRYATPRGIANNFDELILQMQLHSEEIRSLWASYQEPLNTNVPEFYPKFVQSEEAKITYEMIPNIQPWLNYGYPLRHSDFHELAALTSELGSLGMSLPLPLPLPLPVSQQTCATQTRQQLPSIVAASSSIPKETRSSTAPIPKEPLLATRRLYSAVLQNHVLPTVPTTSASTTVNTDELDELEREAIEQYRPSNENFTKTIEDSIVSAKFQELERLALEQYSNNNCVSATEASASIVGGSGAGELGGCSTSSGNGATPLHKPPCGGKPNPYATLLLANSVLAGFYRSRLLSFLSSGARFR